MFNFKGFCFNHHNILCHYRSIPTLKQRIHKFYWAAKFILISLTNTQYLIDNLIKKVIWENYVVLFLCWYHSHILRFLLIFIYFTGPAFTTDKYHEMAYFSFRHILGFELFSKTSTMYISDLTFIDDRNF